MQRDTKVNRHNKKLALSSLSQPDIVVINTTERCLKKTLTRTMHSTPSRLLIWGNTVCPSPKIGTPGPYMQMIAFGLNYLKLSGFLVRRIYTVTLRVIKFVISQFGRILILILLLWKRNYFKYISSTHITSTTRNYSVFLCNKHLPYIRITFFSSILQAPVTHSRFWPL